MYRDLIEEPVRFRFSGAEWWYQKFNGWDGNLRSVVLFDEDGCTVGEFSSMNEMRNFLRRAVRV